jgi:SNF2 family DNA or RNA helicase
MVEKSQWGTHIIANQPDAMQKIKENTRDIYHARTQDQVLDLPEFIFESVAVPMENGQEKAYSTMEDEFFAELPEGDVLLAPNVLSQLIRLIQIASNPILIGGVNESNKWKYAVEMLDYIDLPVIIWTNFINTAESIVNQIKAAKFRAASLTGRTPPIERQNIVDNFQNGNLDVIVAHPGVGKFGFTLTAARTAIYLERSYNGDDYFQSLHRIRRIGTTVSPRVIILLSVTQNMEETIDHVIDKILEFRKNSSLDMTQGLTSGVLRKMWRKND